VNGSVRVAGGTYLNIRYKSIQLIIRQVIYYSNCDLKIEFLIKRIIIADLGGDNLLCSFNVIYNFDARRDNLPQYLVDVFDMQ
jgi:hypothetical protein